MRTLLAVLPALMAAAAGQPPSALQEQAIPPVPETVLRVSVALVQVDAAVTDREGRHVTDLEPEDFEVLQDGIPQKISHFSFIRTGSVRPRGATPQRAAPAAVPAPSPRLRREEVRRTIALVVDDLGLSFESAYRVRRALRKFVDEQMEPGDLVAIVRTRAGMGALQQFTTDKRQLHAAIERVRCLPFGRVGAASFEPAGQQQWSMPAPGKGEEPSAGVRHDEFTGQFYAVGTLGAIRFVVNGLKEMPGRKSVVLFSENMPIQNSEGLNRSMVQALERLTDLANRAAVVIYSIDPRGLQWLGMSAADNLSGRKSIFEDVDQEQEVEDLLEARRNEYFESQNGLVYLARETGGMFLGNSNDMNELLGRAMADQEGYYLLGYRPDTATWDEKTGKPKFHRVRVRVKRPGLRVRSRNGFYGVPDDAPPPAPETREEQLAAALASPFGAAGVHVKLTPLFFNNAEWGSYVHTLLHMQGRDFTFEEEPDGWRKAMVDITMTTFGEQGEAVDHTDRTFTVRIKGETYKRALAGGFTYRINHPVRKPGAYQMRAAIRDGRSGRVGAASQYIEIPDVKKGRLALSGIVMTPYAPTAGNAVADTREGRVEDTDPRSSPAMRVFQPGKALIYGFYILNAARDPKTKLANLHAAIRIFREGQEVYTGKDHAIDGAGQPDFRRIAVGAPLQLGKKMEPGEYVLQVLVTDQSAKEKNRTASQWIDFEIAP